MTASVNADALYDRAMKLVWSGRADDAAPLLQQAVAAGSTRAMSLLEEMYRQAIAAEGHPSAFNNLAVLLLRRGEVTEAEQLLRKAVEAGDGRATANLANLLVRRGEHAEAERLIERFNSSSQ